MAFDSTFTVGEKTYTLQSWNPAGSVRIATNSSLAEPDLLTISHEVIKGSATKAPRDAHLVKNTITFLDSNEKPQTAAVYLRFDIPRSDGVTISTVRSMLCAVLGVVLSDDFALTGVVAADQEGIDKLADVLLGLS